MDWLKRWWQHLGFGIESRTDYDFLHDVIREKLPYYIYDDMRRAFPDATRRQRKRAQLLFRLGNHIHPTEIVFHGRPTDLNKYALTHTLPNPASKLNPPCVLQDIARRTHHAATLLFIEGEPMTDIRAVIPSATMIIITDIDAVNALLWQTILHLPHSITFDMRHLGIAIIDLKRFTAHYNI